MIPIHIYTNTFQRAVSERDTTNGCYFGCFDLLRFGAGNLDTGQWSCLAIYLYIDYNHVTNFSNKMNRKKEESSPEFL